VITIKMLRAGTGRAAYYLDRSADCHPSGYYLEETEPAGRWCGHGAAALGLEGLVTGAGPDVSLSNFLCKWGRSGLEVAVDSVGVDQ
jgi:hypothetical protein